MCYMNGMHWGSSSYLKANGRPIISFPDETVNPSTGPALHGPMFGRRWGSGTTTCQPTAEWLPTMPTTACRSCMSENAGGFTHQDTSRFLLFIRFEPSSTALVADQFTSNISPAIDGGTLDNFLATASAKPRQAGIVERIQGLQRHSVEWGTGPYVTGMRPNVDYFAHREQSIYPTTDVPVRADRNLERLQRRYGD